jgi:hypothetical protein
MKQAKIPYVFQVLLHKWFVMLAGLKVGNIPLWRLLIHDWTKFLPVEFWVYRKRFTGKKYSEHEWVEAKNHHKLSNPHHWEYWISNSVPIPMPEVFVREMVADWMAAGRSYKGSWDIQPWLKRNSYRIKIHEKTLLRVNEILRSVGFKWPD